MPPPIGRAPPAAPRIPTAPAAGAGGPPKVDFTKDGPLSMPLTVQVNGKPAPAKFVGTLSSSSNNMDGRPAKYILEPRVEIGGKKFLLTDGALAQLLSRAGGYSAEHGFSGQTRVFGDSLRGMIGLAPKAVGFDGSQFVVAKGDGYYHDNFVCVNGPGLPRVDY